MTALTIGREDPRTADIAALLRLSEEQSHALYPPESVHVLPIDALAGAQTCFLAARASGALLGCGAFVHQEGGYGELKSIVTSPQARRQGVGSAVLVALEGEALAAGLHTLRLETGVAQPEAIALYRKHGYGECGPFADYRPDPLSVFMTKSLRGSSTTTGGTGVSDDAVAEGEHTAAPSHRRPGGRPGAG